MLQALIFCIAQVLVFWVIGSCFWHSKKTKIVPAPVLSNVSRRAIAMLREITQADKPYKIADLGCGWGGPLKKIAKAFPHADITGYELSPWPLLVSRVRSAFCKSRIQVLKQDFFEEDLSGYDIVFCYLSPYHMERLKPQLKSLKPGSIIVSCSFKIEGWTPYKKEVVQSIVKIPVYIYCV